MKTLNVTGRSFKRCATHGPAICRFLRRALDSLPLLLWAVVLTSSQGYSQADPEDNGPLLLSMSPLTGQRGISLKVEVRGNRLDGVYAVWSDNSGMTGRVLSVEEVKDLVKPRVRPSQQEIKPIPVFRVLLDLQIDPLTRVGVHSLRLVSHRGVSNAFSFPVVDAPVTMEASSSHQTIEQAQPATFPGFISGKLGEPGEVDFFSFQARKGQELRFEVVEGQKFDHLRRGRQVLRGSGTLPSGRQLVRFASPHASALRRGAVFGPDACDSWRDVQIL